MIHCHVLIVAAGSGSRAGPGLPKQYRPLAAKPLLRHAIDAFLDHPAISGMSVVIDPAHRPLYEAAIAGLALPAPVAGGATRQDSVRRGLENLAAAGPPDLVLIHDAARPFIDHAMLGRLLAALDEGEAAIPALPVVDSLKHGNHGFIAGDAPRDGLWRAQTPQGFRFAAILAAHRQAREGLAATDDAAIATAAGLKVKLVRGSEANIKLTEPEDFARAESWLSRQRGGGMEYRTGNGFDVHRLVAGDRIVLCGVEILHDRSLEGHSDADVAIHALTDAILGALGAEDIGAHFPPSDPQWRGAPSWRFLAHAGALAAAKGGRIVHCDVTLICERPRIGPHREAMIARLAEILGLARERVSVKATTTERLGFTGRGEGIAAQATATIALPLS